MSTAFAPTRVRAYSESVPPLYRPPERPQPRPLAAPPEGGTLPDFDLPPPSFEESGLAMPRGGQSGMPFGVYAASAPSGGFHAPASLAVQGGGGRLDITGAPGPPLALDEDMGDEEEQCQFEMEMEVGDALQAEAAGAGVAPTGEGLGGATAPFGQMIANPYRDSVFSGVEDVPGQPSSFQAHSLSSRPALLEAGSEGAAGFFCGSPLLDSCLREMRGTGSSGSSRISVGGGVGAGQEQLAPAP
uniref:Uncharacterized protein n=1 Tax=Chromera velia CCMP2878 TaxID=1169474 RepID=A0A0G4GBC6_9ALVE|eukprot:Cvel_20996.t1-p1 / transcript=Cvel_20996.t1 / gene=Cvel_20996 / organism=Chromera_velia_CCMP2878 / gene_product=hypothetical protein / transcript_product=hypothetical protein / location=Cvel_scaffold1933:21626-22930(+) / protein_length=243 / sequence_SO=supercontig / SO=protein_coding / is_pseudo=false